jgi:hypothetical protein
MTAHVAGGKIPPPTPPPVRNDRPKRLTPDQIDQLNPDGFLQPFPVFGLEKPNAIAFIWTSS